MKCHYEVLDIQKTATDDEIKKSYRKLALKWHPDKNPDQTDECTKQFHLIQQAYEVLIDPQERAWYDKHREAILRGGLGHGDKYEDDSLDVYQYFNTACYSGFGDDDTGFYTVYRGVFEKIATEDMEYMDQEDHSNIPGFGESTSDYDETVGPFYAYWESYCTMKSYVWAEKYDTREAPHRQVRRAMEQENKKLRDKAKKERNEEVRALVAFVRKRDKRVQAYKKKLEERALEIKRLTEEKRKKQKEEKWKKFENYKEADWSAMEGLEKDLEALDMEHAKNFEGVEHDESDTSQTDDDITNNSNAEQEEEEELYYDELYCVACNKPFKTQKAFDNHENSKKHKQNIDLLKVEMTAEEEVNGCKEDRLSGSGIDDDDDELDDVMYDDLFCQYCDKFFTDEQALYAHTTSKKHKDTVDALRPPPPENDDVTTGSDGDNTKTDDITNTGDTNNDTCNLEENPEEDDTSSSSKSKKSKKQKGKKQRQEENKVVNLNCNVCKQEFPTRNKLFDHIKETNHALRMSEEAQQTTTAKSKKQKKNKKK